MSGQISAAWNIFASIPTVAALLIGGHLSGLLEDKNADQAARMLFLLGAAIMASVAVYAAWKPASVFDNVRTERAARRATARRSEKAGAALAGLSGPADLAAVEFRARLSHAAPVLSSEHPSCDGRPVGSVERHLRRLLHSDLHGVRLSLPKAPVEGPVLWGTIVAIPQMVPLLFIHSVTGALIAAVPMGLMGGVATAAYLDLIIRSCPRGLQGTTLMMSGSLFLVASRFGDVLGTNLYDYYGGFAACVIAITVVYALILPMLLVVPSDLIATADGQS